MKISIQGFGDTRPKKVTETDSGHPFHQFSKQIALGHGVITRLRARFPPRCLSR